MLGIHEDKICKTCSKTFHRKNKPYQEYCSIRCGLLNRITLDNNIFEDINDISMYILGLIWSDGNLYKQGNGRPLLDITSKDKQIIDRIHSIVTPKKKLYSYQPKRGNKIYSIKTRDPRITDFLQNIGLMERKSHTIVWPTINMLSYEHSFIRGVFDGDGCVYTSNILSRDGDIILRKNKYTAVAFTGCRNDFFNTLYEKLLRFNPKWTNDKRTDTWKICIYNKAGVHKFAKYIYDKEKICLERKKQVFLDNGYFNTQILLDKRKFRNGLKKN